MFTVFKCRKCGHRLYVSEKGFPQKLEIVAGHACSECGEQDEGLWGLLGRSKKFRGEIIAEWEEPVDEEE